MLGQYPHIVAGVFFGRKRIDVAADRVNLVGDLLRGARRGSLEKHMLNDMGDAAHVARFIACADADPNPKSDRLDISDVFGDDADAVGKHFALYHSL